MAAEILVVTPAIRALIRDDKIHQIYWTMQSGKKFGMQTMNDALYKLYMSREVAEDECLRASHDPERVPAHDRQGAGERREAAGGRPDGGEAIDRGERVNRERVNALAAVTAATDRRTAITASPISTPRFRMPTFTYTARTSQRRAEHGDDRRADPRRGHRAAAPAAAERRQDRRGRTPSKKQKKGGTIKMRDIVIFTRQFSTMINAGLPLVQALDILAKQSENPALKDVTTAVVFDVESGHTVADALPQAPEGVQRSVREHGGRR